MPWYGKRPRRQGRRLASLGAPRERHFIISLLLTHRRRGPHEWLCGSPTQMESHEGTMGPRSPGCLDGQPYDGCYEDFVRIFDQKYVVDTATGRSYRMGSYALEALRQLLSLHYPPFAPEEDEHVKRAKHVLIELRRKGHFTEEVSRNYQMLSDSELNHPKLHKLILCITDICNLRCAYCPYSRLSPTALHRIHGNTVMEPNVIEHALRYLEHFGDEDTVIGFYGGEPLIQFDLIREVLGKIRRSLPSWKGRITATSNLTYYTHSLGDFLAANKFFLIVSLDGPKSIHDRYRRYRSGTGSFDTVFRNLRDLCSRHPDYARQCIATNSVLTDLPDLDELDSFFANEVPPVAYSRFSVASSFDAATGLDAATQIDTNTELCIDEWLIRKLKQITLPSEIKSSPLLLGLCIERLHRLVLPNSMDTNGVVPFPGCIPGNKIMVNIDGSFSICEQLESLKIGNVVDGLNHIKIAEIIHDYQSCINDRCINCWAFGFCRMCLVHAWNGSVVSSERLSKHCDQVKARAERLLGACIEKQFSNPTFFDELFTIDSAFM
jgi:uncharacterized protein